LLFGAWPYQEEMADWPLRFFILKLPCFFFNFFILPYFLKVLKTAILEYIGHYKKKRGHIRKKKDRGKN